MLSGNKLLPEPVLTKITNAISTLDPNELSTFYFHFPYKLDPYSFYLQNLVKVQFRGPELYKKKGALFQEESYLPRIFRSSSLKLHTFHLIHIVFWWQIFFRKHGKLTPTIGKTAMFWSSTLWSWRHNAGARELSANHTLQSMTTMCR